MRVVLIPLYIESGVISGDMFVVKGKEKVEQ
jgi:hypothetical protein